MRLPEGGTPCWWNGKRVAIEDVRVPLGDPAVQAGLGLFETIAVRGGRPAELDAHVERLSAGAARLGIAPPSREDLRGWIREAAGVPQGRAGWVKVIVTGGGEAVVFAGDADPLEVDAPVRAAILPWRRNPHDPLSGLKTLGYAANVLGERWAAARGADEGIWLNTKGHLAEGCYSNLFVISGRKLFTAAERDGILPGVIRSLTLEAARGLGLTIHEGKVRTKRLQRADEAFLTSSVRGVRPLVEIDGKAVGKGRTGPWTKKIAREVERIRMARLDPASPQKPRDGEVAAGPA